MALNSPSSVELQDIQFKLHEKLRLFAPGDTLRSNVNLLATSSSVGLLFACNPSLPELKVFIVKELVDGKVLDKPPRMRTIPLPSVANVIACSADGSLLAINSTINGGAFVQIYSVSSFVTQNIRSLYNIRLSSEENVSAVQLLWNPVLTGNLAAVLSNGSLVMFTLKEGGNFEMHSLDRSQQVKCGCWSPKGKQIVLGFGNGRLQQFKPDLTPAKTIACPPGVHPGPFDTIALHWLSTFQFAAVFLQQGPDMGPSLYIVNAPKGGTPTYTNYYDICYSANGPRAHQVSFTHVPQWNLLLVTSANGIEVGILGTREAGDMPTWQHFTQLDEVRIEMPLFEKKIETYPMGFAFDTSSSHQLIVGEKALPVMPLVHVLSTGGDLVSFNFLNLMQGAVDVCSPPPPIADTSGEFVVLTEAAGLADTATPQISELQSSAQPTVAVNWGDAVTSTPAMKEKAPPMFGATTQASGLFSGADASFGIKPAAASTGFGAIPTDSASIPFSAAPPSGGNFSGFGSLTARSTPSFGGFAAAKPADVATTMPQVQQQSQSLVAPQPQVVALPQSVAHSSLQPCDLNKPLYTVSPTFTPPTAVTAGQLQPKLAASKSPLTSSETDESVRELIAEQINLFDLEIRPLAEQSRGLLANMGNMDELRGYTKRLNDLQEINEQAKDRDFEMDVQNLQHALNETRIMLTECRTKLEIYLNPDITRLTNVANFDPINRRQLTKLQSALNMNHVQLQQFQNLIDAQWSSYQDMMRRNTKSKMHIPCLDGIYQRMTKLKDMLSRQRTKLNYAKAQLKQKGLICKTMNDSDHLDRGSNVTSTNALESLTDSMLSMQLSHVVDSERSKLSPAKLAAIRRLTRDHQQITIIRPQRPDRVGLKSEVILETKLQNDRKARESAVAANIKAAQQQVRAKQQLPKSPMVTASVAASMPTVQVSPQLPKPTATKATPMMNSFAPSTTSTLSFNVGNASPFMLPTSSSAASTKTLDANKAFFSMAAVGGSSPFTTTNFTGFGSNPLQPLSSGSQPKPTQGSALKEALAAPISFSAKVIGGNVTSVPGISKPLYSSTASTLPGNQGFAALTTTNNSTAVTATKPPMPTVKENPKPEMTTKLSTLGFVGEPTAAAPGTVNKPAFSGFNAPAIGKSPSINNFSFSGFGNALSATPAAAASGPVPAATTSSGFSFLAPASAVASLNTSGVATTTSIFATVPTKESTGALKSSSAGNMATVESTVPDTTTQAATATQADAAVITCSAATTVSTTLTAKTASATVSSSVSPVDVSEALLDSLDICKPSGTGNPTDNAPETAASAFPAFGGTSIAGNLPSVFSFSAAASGSTFSFGAAAKALDKQAAAPIATAASTTPASFGATAVAASSSSTTPSIAVGAPIFSAAAGPPISTTSTVPTSVIASTTTNTTGSSTASALFGGAASFLTPAAVGSIFGGASIPTPATTTAPSIFAATAAATAPAATIATTSTIFGVTTTTPAGGGVFGGAGMPKSEPSVFGSSSSNASPASGGGLFAAAAAANPSPFSSPTATAGSGGSIFGGSASATSGFGAPAAGGSIFGGATSPTSPFAPAAAVNTGGSIFGGAVKAGDGGNVFGSPTQAAPASGGPLFGKSAFGQTAQTGSSIFGSTAPQQPAAVGFGGSASIFGGSTAAPPSGGSIFGGGNAAPTPGFGGFAQTPNASAFGSPVAGGSFATGGSPSVAQSGFGSSQQSSAFGKPVFGGSPAFGSPPAFGAQPSFGGAATFGSPKSFGSFAAPNAATTPPGAGVFGGAPQKNNLFEALGSTDSGISFGNLAQGTNANAPKPAFGGSSFMNYRA